jgi:hypothetical protein
MAIDQRDETHMILLLFYDIQAADEPEIKDAHAQWVRTVGRSLRDRRYRPASLGKAQLFLRAYDNAVIHKQPFVARAYKKTGWPTVVVLERYLRCLIQVLRIRELQKQRSRTPDWLPEKTEIRDILDEWVVRVSRAHHPKAREKVMLNKEREFLKDLLLTEPGQVDEDGQPVQSKPGSARSIAVKWTSRMLYHTRGDQKPHAVEKKLQAVKALGPVVRALVVNLARKLEHMKTDDLVYEILNEVLRKERQRCADGDEKSGLVM